MTGGLRLRPPIADDQLLDEVVTEINRIHRSATVDLALTIGKLIVERFYAGELAVWRRHAGKEASFRKLAARAGRDLHMTATTLYRAVALYELTQRLGVSTWKHLSVSHLRAVLGLPEDEQRQLLATADLSCWTTARLEAEARQLRCARLGKRGRLPLPGFMKTINRLVGLLANGDAVRVDPEALRCLDDFERQRLTRTLGEVQASLTRLQQQIESCLRVA